MIDPRGLVTQISYDAPANPPPNVTIPDTPNVNFTYDNLGNRISMTDGTGTTTYIYDELSRITSETKDFTDLTNNLTISYGYHLGGGLKSITDPFNATINYTNDKTGRVTTVAGTPWTQNPTGEYARNIKYRAFGAVKQMDYVLPGETPQVKLGYDNRLRVNHQEVTLASSSGGFLMKADFTHFADSRVQAKDDLLDNKWDRTMKYDFAGRLAFNQFGLGLGSDGYSQKRVYQQAIGYDAFSQMTTRSGVHWDNDIGYTESYTNSRINNNPDIIYDAAGNIAHSGNTAVNPHDFQNTTFDASGRRTGFFGSSKGRWGSILNMVTEHKSSYQFDGDGRPVVEGEGYRNYHINDAPPPAGWQPEARSFQVWSSVLGSSLTVVLADGSKQETKIFAGGAVIAKQSGANEVGWTTADPVTGTTANLGYSAQFGNIGTTEETEPLGQKLRQHDPAEPPEPQPNENRIGSADDPHWQCEAGEAFWGGFSEMPFHCQKKMLSVLVRTSSDN